MSAARIEGIFVPNIVPLDARGEINEPELRRYTELADRRRACMACIPTARPASSPASRPKSGGGSSRSWPTKRAAGCRFWPAPPKRTSARRSRPANTITGLGVRAVAIVSPYLLQAQPAERLRLFQARSAIDTPIDVTLYNIPMFASPIDVPTVATAGGRVPADRGDQGFVGRHAAHDPHDQGGAARTGPTSASSPAGMRP